MSEGLAPITHLIGLPGILKEPNLIQASHEFNPWDETSVAQMANSIRELEDRIWLDSVPALIDRLNRESRLRFNKRKKQRRQRTGRR